MLDKLKRKVVHIHEMYRSLGAEREEIAIRRSSFYSPSEAKDSRRLCELQDREDILNGWKSVNVLTYNLGSVLNWLDGTGDRVANSSSASADYRVSETL